MRKGFTVALLTVAVAMLGSNAMSMAPVISNIKDIVVADDAPVSGANEFVYPDAIDLRTVASDQDTSNGGLIWSYSESSNTYLINGAATLAGADDPVLPPAAKRIAGPGSTATDDTDPHSGDDGSLFTITVRNKVLSPMGGVNTDPPGVGIIASQTKALTFFVSDQDQTDSTTILVYTEDNGTDHLSPAGGPLVYSANFATGTQSWASLAGQGTVTIGQSASGLCLTVPAAGDNTARWDSPYGLIPLTDNTVYEIRVTMNTTQTAALSIPFWDISVIDTNLNPAFNPSFGANAYGGDFFCLDNLSGAEGIGRFRSEFVFYFVPPPVAMPGWRSATTGIFQPAADNFNDFQFNFRIFDMASNGFGAQNDSGSVCLQRIDVFSHDFTTRQNVGAAVFSQTNLTAANTAAVTFGDTTFTFTGGDLTVAPANATSWDDSLDFVRPGAGADGDGVNPMPAASWPITDWQSDKLYLMSMETSIPSAASQTNGIPDLLYIVLEGGAQQTHQLSFVLPNIKITGAPVGAGMPPIAPTTAKYYAFGYTNEASKDPAWDAMRPEILIQNSPGLNSPTAISTGSFTIHGWDVQEVTF